MARDPDGVAEQEVPHPELGDVGGGGVCAVWRLDPETGAWFLWGWRLPAYYAEESAVEAIRRAPHRGNRRWLVDQ